MGDRTGSEKRFYCINFSYYYYTEHLNHWLFTATQTNQIITTFKTQWSNLFHTWYLWCVKYIPIATPCHKSYQQANCVPFYSLSFFFSQNQIVPLKEFHDLGKKSLICFHYVVLLLSEWACISQSDLIMNEGGLYPLTNLTITTTN